MAIANKQQPECDAAEHRDDRRGHTPEQRGDCEAVQFHQRNPRPDYVEHYGYKYDIIIDMRDRFGWSFQLHRIGAANRFIRFVGFQWISSGVEYISVCIGSRVGRRIVERINSFDGLNSPPQRRRIRTKSSAQAARSSNFLRRS